MANNLKLSITFPSIRLENLPKVINSIKNSCTKYEFEVVIASPYPKPDFLENISNIKWIKTFSSPSVAWNLCYLYASGFLCIDGSDDAIFLPGVLDEAIEMYESQCGELDVISLQLNEGVLDKDLNELPHSKDHKLHDGFFICRYNQPFWKKIINPNWRLSLNFLMRLDTFFKLGGFDCRYEYVNHSLHSIILLLQSKGGNVIPFPKRSLLVAHEPLETGTHFAVHQAQKNHDEQIFDDLFNKLNNWSEYSINLNNWKEYDYSLVWKRRFKDIEL